ncbi:FadR/GntR family transcriptional regulator [Oceanobacillus halophilus]
MLPNQKVYHGVLEKIRIFIEDNNLSPGDKLPSERELSETLNASRSSIREAFRALELLGIIETRHGEGTFLSSYRPFQTVEILASFILREKNTKESILVTKKLLEKEAAKLAFHYMKEADIAKLQESIRDFEKEPNKKHKEFFSNLFINAKNELLLVIWQLIVEFSQTFDKQTYENDFYCELIKLYSEKDYPAIETLFTDK